MNKKELKELEERIEKLKGQLSDFLRLAKAFEMSDQDIQIRVNIMLDDLVKLLKRKEQLNKK
ncbi:MAG: hypothetical protein Q4A09_07775 [Capnocytophaga felis]|nr:hypothetical protein [Capnocytophaga felis]